MARMLPRGKEKFKDKLHIIFFNVTRLVIFLQNVLTRETMMKGAITNTKGEEMISRQ